MNEFIKSPINYTGNKYRILPQITKYFPDNINTFVDLFCGGATVGFNVDANHIVLIDKNPRVINLLKTLAEKDFDKIIKEIENNIFKYNLSYSLVNTYAYYRKKGYVIKNDGLKKYNSNGYYKLREDYNSLKNKNSFKANIMLYTLMIYGFNNDIRFNSDGNYNLPVGKTDFNKNNYNKLLSYNQRAKNISYEFICADFRNKKVNKIIKNADFVYCDPPYLITTAVYNENHGWSEKEEIDLLNLLKEIDENNNKFALSNVLKKTNRTNTILESWIDDNKFNKHNIEYHYRSASYNKKNRDSKEEEVLITNEN